MDLQILLGVERVDEVALSAMPQQHSSGFAGDALERSGSKDQRVVNGLFDVKWRGGQEVLKSGGRAQGTSGTD